MGLQASVAGGVALTAIMGLLSLGMLGILVTMVVKLNTLSSYPSYASLSNFPVTADTLKTLKIINGALLVIPLVIFILCAFDIGKLVANPTQVVAKKVAAQVQGGQSLVKRRPIIFGSLFLVLSAGVATILIYDGIVLGQMESYFTLNTPPSGFPLSLQELKILSQVALYTAILPALVIIFSIALIFKAISEKKKSAETVKSNPQ